MINSSGLVSFLDYSVSRSLRVGAMPLACELARRSPGRRLQVALRDQASGTEGPRTSVRLLTSLESDEVLNLPGTHFLIREAAIPSANAL